MPYCTLNTTADTNVGAGSSCTCLGRAKPGRSTKWNPFSIHSVSSVAPMNEWILPCDAAVLDLKVRKSRLNRVAVNKPKNILHHLFLPLEDHIRGRFAHRLKIRRYDSDTQQLFQRRVIVGDHPNIPTRG